MLHGKSIALTASFALPLLAGCNPVDTGYYYPDDAPASDGPEMDATSSPDVPRVVPRDAARDVPRDVARPPVDVPPPDVPRVPNCATVTCNTGAACVPATGRCACMAGYTGDGTTCTPVSSGDPQTRARAEMCARWAADRVPRAARTWNPGASRCDPGTIDPDALADGMRVLNVYRWLSGLQPAGTAPSLAASQQACALMETVNGTLSHFPPTSWACYNAAGAAQAGMSNLAGGTMMSPVYAVQLWMDETDQNLGHRRWCLHPPLGPTYFGSTDGATCMNSFASGGSTDAPPVSAYPNPGFAPLENAMGTWSAQDGASSVGGRSVSMTDDATGAALAVASVATAPGYGGEAVGWHPSGWSPAEGHTYRVTLTASSGAPAISYTVTPVRCP